jgi:fatty acid desaturase
VPVTDHAPAVGSPDLRIPGKLNVTLALLAYSFAIGLLWLASHTGSTVLLIGAAIGFSYVGNTIFSLLHEAVHGSFHSNRNVNNAFGIVSAAFFPTSFTFQRVCHLGHHRRNRTDLELFDYYYPEDNRFIKFYRLYCLLTGFYWLSIPFGCAVFFLLRGLFVSKAFLAVARPLGLGPMIGDLSDQPPGRIRLEIGFTILLQALLFWALSLTLTGWFVCYVAFALNWCSLQYTDHAWTVRDIRNGAWNLKVNRTVQYIFLNYHHHLAHHQNPKVPWIHLPKFVDFDKPRPSYLRIYLSLWRGPRPIEQPPPGALDPELERQLVV